MPGRKKKKKKKGEGYGRRAKGRHKTCGGGMEKGKMRVKGDGKKRLHVNEEI